MKQGSGNSSMGDQKREPVSHAVDPGAVSQIGVHEVNYVKVPLYTGRGFEAPMAGSEVHPCGSQGKHK